jgi:uncharacterized LabA/DUF88 family protein
MVDLPQGTRLAILIDAENISPTVIKQVLLRLQSYKGLLLKRAYGDWSKPHLNRWKPLLIDWGIQAVHSPTYTVGKNSADMALTIDAIDLLSQQVNWFCIVSNDSDFTPLAHRLNVAGARVVGFGTRKASRAFENACHRFIVIDDAPESIDTVSAPVPAANGAGSIATTISATETLAPEILTEALTETLAPGTLPSASIPLAPAQTQRQTQKLEQKPEPIIPRDKLGEVLQRIFCSLSADNSWLALNALHSQVQKRYPKFSCKQVGYSGLVKMVEGVGRFEIRQRQPDAQQPDRKIIEIRLKAV